MRRALLFLVLLLIWAQSAAAEAGRYGAYIDGPWGQIHVRVEGRRSDPTVFLIHQMVWSSEQYHFAQIALAERGVRSVAIDIPGYGLSDGPPFPPTAGQYAEILVPILKHFGIRKANLLGTNTGSTFISAFAVAHPELVNSLILEGVTIWNEKDLAALIASEYGDQIPGADGRAVLNHPNVWYAHDAVFKFDMESVLPKLKAPVMLLVYPGLGTYRTARKTHERFPQFALSEIDCTTQVAAFDTPKPWAEAVAAFVRRQR